VEVNVNEADILTVLEKEVIKRDAMEGPAAVEAVRRISRREEKPLRKVKSAQGPNIANLPSDHDRETAIQGASETA